MRTPTAARRLAFAALLPLVLTGCGLFGGDGRDAYGPDKRTVTADAGKKFTLKMPVAGYMGENWYLGSPRPDSGVLRYDGKRREVPGGGKGSEYFDFTAVASGTATVKLLHCPRGVCHSVAEAEAEATAGPSPTPVPTATGTPGEYPEYFVYEITVH